MIKTAAQFQLLVGETIESGLLLVNEQRQPGQQRTTYVLVLGL